MSTQPGAGYHALASRRRSDAEPFRAGVIQWLRRPGDGGRESLAAGFWFVGPDDMPPRTEVSLHLDETVCIIEGRIRIEIDGTQHELREGDSLTMNAGALTRWTILQDTVEFFVYS